MSQPDPVSSDREHIADLVVADIQDRKRRGVREYGTALQPMNGRRALWDLYEELLDAAHYTRQRILEEHLVLVEMVGDAQVRQTLKEIYDRCDLIAKRPGQVNRQALEHRYTDDISYLRMVIEAQQVALATLRAPAPTGGLGTTGEDPAAPAPTGDDGSPREEALRAMAGPDESGVFP